LRLIANKPYRLNGINEDPPPPKGLPPKPPSGLIPIPGIPIPGIAPIDIGELKPPIGESGDIGLIPGIPPNPIGDV